MPTAEAEKIDNHQETAGENALQNKPAARKTRNEKQMAAIKKARDIFNQCLEEIPETRYQDLIDLIQEFAEKSQHEPIMDLPSNKSELKALGIELYPDFKRRTGEANGLKCLEENYSLWLKKYTPNLNRDYMCQADLGRLDPQLLSRLRRLYKAEELNKTIPSEQKLNEQIAETISAIEKKEVIQKYSIIYRHTDHLAA